MRAFHRETTLYALALVVGLAVRFAALGAAPLNDLEANRALQALGTASGARPALGSQPAYVLLTSIVFFVYGGATDALARLIPALAGSALVLVPALFKERLKPRPATILAFAIALEPGLVALSRQAGSSILIITFTLAAWGFWEKRRTGLAGVCAGLALLSGSALWVGLLGFVLAWAIWQPFARGGQGAG
jgi:predicted membrane-bound mannosyltransferase